MKKNLLALLLLCSALAWARSEPNPADYKVNIHVSSSTLNNVNQPRLSVIIDGKKCELQGVTTDALLALGDYKAKLIKDEHKTTYDSYQIYEFLFPDGKTRQYHLVGITE